MLADSNTDPFLHSTLPPHSNGNASPEPAKSGPAPMKLCPLIQNEFVTRPLMVFGSRHGVFGTLGDKTPLFPPPETKAFCHETLLKRHGELREPREAPSRNVTNSAPLVIGCRNKSEPGFYRAITRESHAVKMPSLERFLRFHGGCTSTDHFLRKQIRRNTIEIMPKF